MTEKDKVMEDLKWLAEYGQPASDRQRARSALDLIECQETEIRNLREQLANAYRSVGSCGMNWGDP